MSSETHLLFDILSDAIKHNEFSVFYTNYSPRLPVESCIELFHQACCWDRYAMLDVMVQRGFNVESAKIVRVAISHTIENTIEVPIIFEALTYGSINSLRFLLEHGVSPDVIHPDNGMSALYYAGVRLGLGNRNDFQFMELLLTYKTYVNIKNNDNSGKTLLHAFAKSAPLSMCKRLIDLGADQTITDNDGNTPLDYLKARNLI